MNETAESRVSKWAKLERILKRWEYWVGIAGLALTVGVVVAVIYYFDDIQALGTYGYLGAFLISALGGATYIASVPILPVSAREPNTISAQRPRITVAPPMALSYHC